MGILFGIGVSFMLTLLQKHIGSSKFLLLSESNDGSSKQDKLRLHTRERAAVCRRCYFIIRMCCRYSNGSVFMLSTLPLMGLSTMCVVNFLPKREPLIPSTHPNCAA